MADPKRSLDIEAALRWAFRDELPKVEACRETEMVVGGTPGGLTPGDVETLTQLMMSIGVNRYGVVPNLGVTGEVHPDAILIGQAVEALDDLAIDLPPDWNPLDDMRDLDPEADGLLRSAVGAVAADLRAGAGARGLSLSALVRRQALMGGMPAWEAEVPAVKLVSSANGVPRWFVKRLQWSKTRDGGDVSHEVEEDGFNARSRRPYGDAYRKSYLAPDPTPAIRGRAEYEMLHAGMGVLVDDLAPRLSTIRLRPTARPARPWVWDGAAPSILPDLSDMGPLVPLPPRTGARRPAAAF